MNNTVLSSQPTVAILFFTYDRLDYTRAALAALIENTSYPFELHIVDNHSTDGTAEWLETFRLENPKIVKDIRFNATNEGLPGPTNAFWERVDAELVGKVDNDTLVPAGWLERLVEAHIQLPELAVVGGWHYRSADFNEHEALPRLVRKNGIAILPDEHVGGCCYLMKRSIQQKLGPMVYNQAVKIHGWTDYQHRLVEQGYLVGYLYPLVQLEYMDDPRSPHCLIEQKYQDYTREIWKEHGIEFKDTAQLVEALKIDAERITAGDSPATTEQAGAGYYGYARPEVKALVPDTAKRILDIGCGAGALAGSLKTAERYVAGIEYVPQAADAASQVLDKVYEGDANQLIATIADASFDTVIMADFLEHVADTAAMLSQARRVLSSDGRLILSIPNLRHWSVLKDLLEGHFNYAEAGILDRTHLRFFTRESIYLALAAAGFKIESIAGTAIQGCEVPADFSAACAAAGLDTRTLAEEGRIYQYLIVARPLETAKAQPAGRLTSIIMLTFNQLDYTRLCLESIERHTPEAYELILVDNGSTDGTVDFLKSYAASRPEVKLICNAENRGFAGGNNQGIATATGDYILFLNNDTVVTAGWLARLIRDLEHLPGIGLAGPMSNAVSGQQLVPNVTYRNLDELPAFAAQLNAAEAGRATPAVRLVGFCLIVKRAVLELIGGFDENYAVGNFEDDDLCLRAALAGYTAVIANDVFVHHFGSQSFKGNKLDYSAHINENRARFTAKWPGIVSFNAQQNSYAISIDPGKRSRFLNETGEAAFTAGDYAKALKLFERALKLDPFDSQALNNLGVIRTQLGEPQAGMELFIKVLKREPDNQDALENLKDAMQLAGIPAASANALLAELGAALEDGRS